MGSNDFIGISEDRLHHILGVARKAYEIAKDMRCEESFCQRCFMLGWVHDIGYEFSKTQSDHPRMAINLLRNLFYFNSPYDIYIPENVYTAIYNHGGLPKFDEECLEWRILATADLLVDSKGNNVTAEERLSEIATKYGSNSKQFHNAAVLCLHLNLIEGDSLKDRELKVKYLKALNSCSTEAKKSASFIDSSGNFSNQDMHEIKVDSYE